MALAVNVRVEGSKDSQEGQGRTVGEGGGVEDC